MTQYIEPGIMDIDQIISEVWYIQPHELYLRTRRREIAEARNVAIFISINHFGMNKSQASRKYGIDHSTGHHSIKMVKNLTQTDPVFRRKYEVVRKRMEDTLKLNNVQ